ncbi:MAG: hypothetical protein K1W16_14350 [Lachnospiraceae bacterium]
MKVKHYDLQTMKKMDNMVIRAIKRRRPIKVKKGSNEDGLKVIKCLNNISKELRGSDFKGLLKIFLYPNSSLKKYVFWEVLCRMRGRR